MVVGVEALRTVPDLINLWEDLLDLAYNHIHGYDFLQQRDAKVNQHKEKYRQKPGTSLQD